MHFLVTVAVLGYAAAGGVPAGETARAVADAVRATPGADVIVDGAAAAQRAHAQGWVDARELAFFARGAALVGEGRRALGRVELAEAADKLAAAEAVYAPELARPGVASEAATAALWRGVALFELSRRAEADRAFRRAAALDPAVTLTEAQVRPDVVRAFAQANGARPTAKLAIGLTLDGAPIDAGELRVDGKELRQELDGQAMRREIEIAVGEHLVSVRRPDALPYSKLIDVPPAGLQLDVELVPDRAAQALARLAAQPTEEGMAALFAALPVDDAIVVASARDLGTLRFAGQRVRPGCATATVIAPRADELWRRAAASECRVGAPIDALEAQPIAHPRPAPSLVAGVTKPLTARVPAWRRPWLWMGVVGALGVGVVIVANVVPRAASYGGTLDFHNFALTSR